MRIDIVTLFPEMCENILNESIIGRARARGYLQVCCHQLRDHGEGVHKRVDDCTFGGGKGMLLMAQPIAKAFDEIIVREGTYTQYAGARRLTRSSNKPPCARILCICPLADGS